MAQKFTVSYDIFVNSESALASIKSFQEAAAGMGAISEKFQSVSASIAKSCEELRRLVSYPITMEVNTNGVRAAYQRVKEGFAEVQERLKAPITLNVAVGEGDGALGRLRGEFAAMKELSEKPIQITASVEAAQKSVGSVLTMMREIQAASKVNMTGGVSRLFDRFTGRGGGQINMTDFTNQMVKAEKAMQNINKTKIRPKADVSSAIKPLNLLLEKINEVKANSKLRITASAAGASGAVAPMLPVPTGGGAAPSPAQPKPAAAPKPMTWRQVTGPIYAGTGGSFAGEMIKGMGIAYGLSSLMSGVSGVFKSATEYDNIIQTTRNILSTHDKSGNFDANFDRLNKLSRQVGVETKFTAPEVAAAGKFLAMAGYGTRDIERSIRPITNIALIGDTDLGETADVTTNIMTGYGISGDKMKDVADVLTMTFTKTNTTLIDLAEAFKYSGTIAKQSGVDFEDTAAAIGVMGNAGIKASQAGTTLRMMLMNIQAPTKKQVQAWNALGINPKDSEGNLRNIVTLMSELDEKRKQMGAGQFNNIFLKAFRITASSGALALVSNSGALREVAGLNRNAEGLSEKLAEAKKNTIQGMWAQMTSAFTESGMQGFEQLQDVIREFLRDMINLMKSPDFAVTLKDTMNAFIEILGSIKDVFSAVTTIWDWLPDWAKGGLLFFVKMQLAGNIILAIFKSVYSSFLLLGKLLPMLTTLNNKMIAGLVAVKANGLGGMRASLASSFAGIGSALSSVLRLLLGPVGIIALAGYVGYEIGASVLKTREAVAATEAWGESYKRLGIDRMGMEDPNAFMIGNLRVFNNQLATHNERLRQSIELWNKYWLAKNGPKEEEKKDIKLRDEERGATFKAALDGASNFFDVGRQSRTKALVVAMGGRKEGTILHFPKFMYNAPFANGQYVSYNTEFQLALAQLGLDPNNKRKVALEQYLAREITSATSYADASKILGGAREKYVPKTFNRRWDDLEYRTAKDMTFADAETSRSYVLALRKNMEDVFRSWQDFMFVMKKYDSGEKITSGDIQRVVQARFGFLFDAGAGEFGSNGWRARIKDIYDHPAKYKLNARGAKEITNSITETLNAFVSWYSNIDERYRPLFSQYMNRSVWSGVLPNYANLPSGMVDAPTKAGQKTTIDGKQYTSKWTIMGYVWEDKDGKSPAVQPQSAASYNPSVGDGGGNSSHTGSGGLAKTVHSGADQSQYRSHYDKASSAPKQVIVNIGSLMKVDKQEIDMHDGKQVAAVNDIKRQLATALLDVVQDFNANMV